MITTTMNNYVCNYECKHYFGQINVEAKNKKEGRIIAMAKIYAKGHRNKSSEVIRDCGNCKLKIKL